jgi:hypothetical protein
MIWNYLQDRVVERAANYAADHSVNSIAVSTRVSQHFAVIPKFRLIWQPRGRRSAAWGARIFKLAFQVDAGKFAGLSRRGISHSSK